MTGEFLPGAGERIVVGSETPSSGLQAFYCERQARRLAQAKRRR